MAYELTRRVAQDDDPRTITSDDRQRENRSPSIGGGMVLKVADLKANRCRSWPLFLSEIMREIRRGLVL